jgi:hypothetical protein
MVLLLRHLLQTCHKLTSSSEVSLDAGWQGPYFPIAANSKALALLYNAGFSHGCKDANIIEAFQRYIKQPETNATHHTAEFMNVGYHEGFKPSAALCNAAELTRGRTDKSSPIDNMPILGYNDTSPIDNMSNLPSLKQQH